MDALKENGVQAMSASNIARFAKGQEDFEKKIWAKGAAEVLYVEFGDAADSTTVGYQTYGSATTYGGTTTATATAIPMRRFDRQMVVRGSLYNRNRDKIWSGRSTRKAQGLLFVGDGSMTSYAVEGLIDAMKESGLID